MSDLSNSIHVQFAEVFWLMDKCAIYDGSNKLATCRSGEMATIYSSSPINAKISVQGCIGKLKISLSPGYKYYIKATGSPHLDKVESLVHKGGLFSELPLPQMSSYDFVPTKKILEIMEVDESKRLVVFLTGWLKIRGKNSKVYRYSDILEFELLENGSSVTKGGLGRAVVFGAITGGVGAIVGGVTGAKKTTNICESLKLKITVKDINNPAVFVDIITSKIKTNNSVYQSKYKLAQEALSLLNVICNTAEAEKVITSVENIQTVSPADEIAKFKSLLDNGAITADEYETKKRQLLSL